MQARKAGLKAFCVRFKAWGKSWGRSPELRPDGDDELPCAISCCITFVGPEAGAVWSPAHTHDANMARAPEPKMHCNQANMPSVNVALRADTEDHERPSRIAASRFFCKPSAHCGSQGPTGPDFTGYLMPNE